MRWTDATAVTPLGQQRFGAHVLEQWTSLQGVHGGSTSSGASASAWPSERSSTPAWPRGRPNLHRRGAAFSGRPGRGIHGVRLGLRAYSASDRFGRSPSAVVVDRGEPPAEGRDDDGRREEVGPHEYRFGGGVVGSCDRRDERQAGGDGGDDDESSALAKESGKHDAQSGTDDGPPRERGDRNGCGVDLETDIG